VTRYPTPGVFAILQQEAIECLPQGQLRIDYVRKPS